jgi:hypothetical protein
MIEAGKALGLGTVLVLATLALIYNRAVAQYLVENGTTPFTFLRPQDRIPREDRPQQLRSFREARSFWLPFMRVWVVLFTSVLIVACFAGLVGELI